MRDQNHQLHLNKKTNETPLNVPNPVPDDWGSGECKKKL